MTSDSEPGARPTTLWGAAGTRLLFLIALTVAAGVYTLIAFGMEWRIEAGQIGPGFFPRIVGLATIACCLVAISRLLITHGADEPERDLDDEADEIDIRPADGGPATDVRSAVLIVASAYFVYMFFNLLGALLASVVFLALALTILNRGRHRANAVLAVVIPVALYVLFEVLLETGLPPGVLLPL